MSGRHVRAGAHDRPDRALNGFAIEPAPREDRSSRRVGVRGEDAEQQVSGVHVVVTHLPRGRLGLDDGGARVAPEARHLHRALQRTAAARCERHTSEDAPVALLRTLSCHPEDGADLGPRAAFVTRGLHEVVDDLVPPDKLADVRDVHEILLRIFNKLSDALPEGLSIIPGDDASGLTPGKLVDVMASLLVDDAYERQSLLAEADVSRRQQLLRVQIRNMFNPTPLDEE